MHRYFPEYLPSLSKFNSRTLNPEEYKKFIIQKTKTNDEVKDFYNNILFRKIDFRRFIYTLQSEHNLLNEIENKYLTKEDKEKLLKLGQTYVRYNEGGIVTQSNLNNFIELALQINNEKEYGI